jgi:hypothetical protein
MFSGFSGELSPLITVWLQVRQTATSCAKLDSEAARELNADADSVCLRRERDLVTTRTTVVPGSQQTAKHLMAAAVP